MKRSVDAIISSLICILGGLAVGFLVMLFMTFILPSVTPQDAVSGIIKLLMGPFSSGKYIWTNFGDMIFYATPLIFTGLSVAVSFKTGLFNIGAPGQMLLGTTASLFVALNLHATNRVEGILIWFLAIIMAMIFGMLWGAIPGFLKAFFGINEVIVCIMTNWIAANLTTWFFTTQSNLINTIDFGKTGYLYTTMTTGAYTPKAGLDKIFSGSYIDIGIIVVIIISIIIYIIYDKTIYGYELKACGYNINASKYAGMDEKRNVVLSMALAGLLSGLGAAFYYLNPGIEFKFLSAYSKLPDYGFNGIPASLLAANNPIGIIFSSVLIRYLCQGGDYLVSVGFNRYISDIVIAIIIYFAGFTNFFIAFVNKHKKEK